MPAKTSPKLTSRTSKPDSTSLVLRYLDLLSILPREPEMISTAQVELRMRQLGHEEDIRTLQRNLLTLSKTFGILCFDDCKPFLWSWPAKARQRLAPALTQADALTLLMVKRHLVQMLPTMVAEALQPQFEQAEQRLNGVLSQRQLKDWQKKVLAIPPGQPLQSPATPHTIREVIYSALALDTKFRGNYRLKNGTLRKDQEFNPLGLVIRGPVTYLVATVFDYDDVLLYALHRFQRAELMEETPARRPKDFNLERYVHEEQILGFPRSDGTLQLQAYFFTNSGQHLTESPLSDDQVIEPVAPGEHRVTATVRDTEQLLWWLLGFGPNVRVEQPPQLRDRIRDAARAMLAHYD